MKPTAADTTPLTSTSKTKDRPATAVKLLEAARHVLERSGYDALTVEAITREAGVNTALIRYYFGGKSGLIAALVDWILDDSVSDMRKRLLSLPAGDERAHILFDSPLRALADAPAYKLFFDLVPRLLEGEELRAKLAEMFSAIREMSVSCLVPDDNDEAAEDVRLIAVITLAIADGLALQLLAEPWSVDPKKAFTFWESLVSAYFADHGE